jgi:GNAT superfamily N-acetyltransferase
MDQSIVVRPFEERDAAEVQALFTQVNRLLAPAHMKDAFEDYIELSLKEEIGKISTYYGQKKGSFWVAVLETRTVGMFGLEPSAVNAMELRRMYVAPGWRRRGIAQVMLQFAEDYCRANDLHRLDLSTSEIQPDALAFYRQAGYNLIREEIADAESNKTIGGGIRRSYYEKTLGPI